MNLPETAFATISFAPIEFEIMKEQVELLRRYPQASRELEEGLQTIQRNWRGMSEAEIQEQAQERAASRDSMIRFGGSVIVGYGTKVIRAHIASEHPVIQKAKKVIKEGPPSIRVLDGSEEHWRLEGFNEESIREMSQLFQEIPPEASDDPADGRDMVELTDLSQGTGLSLRGLNVRTNKAAVGAWDIAPVVKSGPRFDIGFVMDTTQYRQDVEVTIFERDGEEPSLMEEYIVSLLPHIREVD